MTQYLIPKLPNLFSSTSFESFQNSLFPFCSKDMNEQERNQLMRERKAVKKLNHEMFALRMDLLYKMSVANHLRESVFWLPSNIDFRGRVYPIPPHCSHMGEINQR